jgi:acyl-ACP thioesterase
VSGDDTADAGLVDDIAWVVRRTLVEVHQSPRFRERMTMTTFCSGTGRSWAERRVSLEGDQGGAVEAVSLWVHLDAESGRPLVLPEGFQERFGEAAAGRKVSARLSLPAEVPPDAVRTPWPLRATDLDPLGHVNNAATWAVVEEGLAALDKQRRPRPPLRAEIEYRLPIDGADRVEIAAVAGPNADRSVSIWLTEPNTADAGEPRVLAAARLTPLPSPG